MKKGRFLLLLICCCAIPQLQAQWDAPVTRYWTVKGHYNPAFAGEGGMNALSLLYRYQWTGIQHAPQRVILNAHLPIDFLNSRHNVGVTGYSLTAGRLRNSLLAAQYNYIHPTRNGNIHLGVQAGILNLSFDEGSARIIGGDGEDAPPSYLADGVKGEVADLGVGIAWQHRRGYAGLSLLHLNAPGFPLMIDSLDLQTDSLQSFIPRTVHFMAAYNIRLFHPLAIEPMLWLQSGNGTTRVQTALRAVVDDRFSGGVSWRSGEGVAFFAGFELEGIEIGYGYDLHRRGLGKASRGSHELTLRYRFTAGQLQPKRHPQKSIRLL